MQKIKCIERYQDLELKKIIEENDELEVTKERAEYLVDVRKLCIRVENNVNTSKEDEKTKKSINIDNKTEDKNNKKDTKKQDKNN